MYRLSVLILVGFGIAFGDGGMVPGSDAMVVEYGQVAVLSHFGGTEQLAVASRFGGEGGGFAWILPVPARPEVDSFRLDFVYELQEFARPLQRGGFGCGEPAPLMGGERYGADSLGVERLEGGVVGDYEYEVLEVSSAESLAGYLERLGYRPGSGAVPVFNHYLDKSWRHFVVARVRDSLSRYEYHNVGISLRFASDSLVYPLYISRLGSKYSGVVLYVLAEHRMHFPGAELWFSGRVGPGYFRSGAGFVPRPCHLTRLLKYYEPEAMEDITLRPAPDDREYRRIVSGYQWYGSFGPMLLLAGMLLVRRRHA